MTIKDANDLKRADDAYLLDYVAGNLDGAEALVIACHVAMNADLQKRVATLETLAGSLLEECEDSASPSVDCLDKVFGKIEKDYGYSDIQLPRTKVCSVLPQPLTRALNQTIDEVEWKRLSRGIEYAPVLKEVTNAAYLLKVAPKTEIASHKHTKTELTLLLQGGLKDDGIDFYRGDLATAYAGEEFTHTPMTLGEQECICLVTNLDSIRLESLIGRTMQSFMRVFR